MLRSPLAGFPLFPLATGLLGPLLTAIADWVRGFIPSGNRTAPVAGCALNLKGPVDIGKATVLILEEKG